MLEDEDELDGIVFDEFDDDVIEHLQTDDDEHKQVDELCDEIPIVLAGESQQVVFDNDDVVLDNLKVEDDEVEVGMDDDEPDICEVVEDEADMFIRPLLVEMSLVDIAIVLLIF